MGLIYRKTVRAGKNGKVNVSKSGASYSHKFGPVTVNSRGRVTVKLGPGLSWRF